jgi:hypothetical protein
LSQWQEENHDFYLWTRVSKGDVFDLFVCVVYTTLVGSKHESKSLFENLAINIVEVQTPRCMVLLGGDFNACIAKLSNTINISNLCELL